MEVDQAETRRILWLVDLAGSEHVGCIEVERERLGGTRFVNTSISALGGVLSSLASKKAHIPYRGEAKAIILGSVSKDNEDCPCVAKFQEESEDNMCSDDFIKLDICAIGVDLLVANSQSTKKEKRPPYNTTSGTSVQLQWSWVQLHM